ncbi:MAG TPA: hypothetical protein ENG12_03070 [Candidatus Altiarchaeales archaeon]|nr:hypothetical protein [Candidatus Altiarchaeales archaeon]
MINTGITKLQLDALREVGTIGTGNASIAFSEMLECEIKLKVPWARLVKVNEVSTMLAPPRELLVEIHSRVTGDINALVVVVFSREDAVRLADIILRSIITREKSMVLDILGRDAIRELCNILIGSYLTALNKFLGIRLCHHVPSISFTLTERSVSDITKAFKGKIEYALVLATDFMEKGAMIRGRLILLLDSASLKILTKRLDEKIKR